jgi:hypothetical protein
VTTPAKRTHDPLNRGSLTQQRLGAFLGQNNRDSIEEL